MAATERASGNHPPGIPTLMNIIPISLNNLIAIGQN